MSQRNYDPGQVAVVVGGFPMTNFGEDTFVEVEYNEDAAELTIGVDGEGALSTNRNTSGRIRVTLMSTSESNVILMGLVALFKSQKQLFPILVKDLNSLTKLASGAKFYPKKIPNLTFGKKATPVVWEFETDKLILVHGGNATL